MKTLTQERLKQVLHYDPDTGFFTRKAKTGFKGLIGARVGSLKKHGYVAIQIDYCRPYAHQLAWLYMTGEWPSEVDHKNGNRSDNRWANLRLATRSQNNGNRKKDGRGSLPKGVIKAKSRRGTGAVFYYGRIIKDGKQIHLGSYRTPEEAHAAYIAAAKLIFGEFARAA